jgi:hypothetical protein
VSWNPTDQEKLMTAYMEDDGGVVVALPVVAFGLFDQASARGLEIVGVGEDEFVQPPTG